MPYEVFGECVTNTEHRARVIDIYAFWETYGIDTDEIYDYVAYKKWTKEEPQEAKDFLDFCIDHHDHRARSLAGLMATDWLEADPDYAVDKMIQSLKDEDDLVVNRIKKYYFDVITDTADETIEAAGVEGYHKILKTLQHVAPEYQGPN